MRSGILLPQGIEELRGGQRVERQGHVVLDTFEEGRLQVFEQHSQGSLRRPVLDLGPVVYDPAVAGAELQEVQDLLLGQIVVLAQVQPLGHSDDQNGTRNDSRWAARFR